MEAIGEGRPVVFDAQAQLSRWLSMAETRVKRSLEKETIEKAKSGKCLICGNPANGNRGLCNAHYLQFYRALMAHPKTRRAGFEEEQIREGRVLATGQLREIRNPNPFASAG